MSLEWVGNSILIGCILVDPARESLLKAFQLSSILKRTIQFHIMNLVLSGNLSLQLDLVTIDFQNYRAKALL